MVSNLTFIEGIYGAAHHYIAYALQTKNNEHSDKHENDVAMLKKHAYYNVVNWSIQLDGFRVGRFYGKKRNGETARQAKELLNQIKEWALK